MNTITRCKPLLGTFVEISITGDESRDRLLNYTEIAFKVIKSIEEKMSFHLRESELSAINRSAFKKPIRISKGLYDVFKKGLDYSRLSDGLFDMTIGHALVLQKKLPDQGINCSHDANWRDIELEDNMIFFHKPLLIDVGGIAKGYAVDRGFKSIQEFEPTKGKLNNIIINAGGDLKRWPWKGEKVAIRIPKEPYTETTSVIMKNSSLATSGPYFGGSIINDGEVIPSGPSVSVFSHHCIDADALTKIYAIRPEFKAQGVEHQNLTIDECGSKVWGTQ